jgi:hypothetical protein
MKSRAAVGACSIALAALVSVSCGVPAGGDVAARAEEERFLVYGVLDVYEFWDADGEDSAQWIASAKARLAGLRGGAVTGGLDSGIVRLYDGAITTVDAYAAFLGRTAGIAASRKQQADRDSVQAFLTGAATAIELADSAGRHGSSEGASQVAGILGGIGRGMDEGARRAQARDAKADAELSAALATFETAVKTSFADAKTILQRLARKNAWPAGEIALHEGVIPSITDIVTQRPRDPFARARLARTRDLSADGRLAAAADFRAAADIVPDRGEYAAVRRGFLRNAALHHVAGASLQAPEFSAGAPPAAAEVLAAVRRYRDADPQDPSGSGGLLLARALAHAGQFKEALGEALAVRERFAEDANFQYLVAQLTSLGGAAEHTAGWIEAAYRLGFTDVARLRADPDLSVFRRDWSDKYAALTTVDTSFQVLMDVMLDDVVVTNASPFALTNVRANVRVRQGASVWTPVVKCDTLATGSSCRLNDFGSIWGGRYDDADAVIVCDQCPQGGAVGRQLNPGTARH